MKFLSKVMLLLILMSSCQEDLTGSISDLGCSDTNCEDYRSQVEAQLDYDWNPECRADLDADGDGIACEENRWTQYYASLSNTGGNNGTGACPTTANCGCSGKNQSPCQSDPCCRWVVGTGCRCR
ncbi:MAG: excalibur calcium-binding domain-containing protein [Bacteroidota bacterium]